MDGGYLIEPGVVEAGSRAGDRPEVFATYSIAGAAGIGIEAAAEALAIEHSLGTQNVPDEILASHGARVDSIDEAAHTARIAYPVANVGSMPALLVAVAGEALETLTFERLRLERLELPVEWLEGFAGPQFGLDGVRRMLGAEGRPLLIAILKPSIGLADGDAASLAAALARAGADIIKDDELNSTIAGHDQVARARAVSEALGWVESESMKTAVYAVNITGPVDRLADIAEAISGLGNVWPMVNEEAVGLDTLRVLAESADRPILCHRAYCGGMVRGGPFGIDASVLTGLTRIAGGDLVHCGGVGGKLFDSAEGSMASMSSCTRPMGDIMAALPIIGGGYWAGSLGAVRRRIGNDDFAFVLGSGVTDHPEGPEAGMRSAKLVLDAELNGTGIAAVAGRAEVARAVEAFGPVWDGV